MRPLPWKRRLASAVQWSLLVDALVLASAALLTTFPWPVWTQAMGTEGWPVGMVVGEIALWLVPLPVGFAAAALWLGRRNWRDWRKSRWLTGITVALCAAAVTLLCKPAVQAWRLGRTLDGEFGAPPEAPPCRRFRGRHPVLGRSTVRIDRHRRCAPALEARHLGEKTAKSREKAAKALRSSPAPD